MKTCNSTDNKDFNDIEIEVEVVSQKKKKRSLSDQIKIIPEGVKNTQKCRPKFRRVGFLLPSKCWKRPVVNL